MGGGTKITKQGIEFLHKQIKKTIHSVKTKQKKQNTQENISPITRPNTAKGDEKTQQLRNKTGRTKIKRPRIKILHKQIKKTIHSVKTKQKKQNTQENISPITRPNTAKGDEKTQQLRNKTGRTKTKKPRIKIRQTQIKKITHSVKTKQKKQNTQENISTITRPNTAKGHEKIEQLRKETNDVIGVMRINTTMVINRGEKLSDLIDKTEELKRDSQKFLVKSKKINKKLNNKNKKVGLYIGLSIMCATSMVLFCISHINHNFAIAGAAFAGAAILVIIGNAISSKLSLPSKKSDIEQTGKMEITNVSSVNNNIEKG